MIGDQIVNSIAALGLIAPLALLFYDVYRSWRIRKLRANPKILFFKDYKNRRKDGK